MRNPFVSTSFYRKPFTGFRHTALIVALVMQVSVSLMAQPTITSFTPASGPVGSLVTITGTNLGSPTAFTIGGVASIAVSNSGTTLVGMVMPGAATGSVSVTTGGGTEVAGASFTVTPTPCPSAQQAKLTGNDVTDWGSAGQSIALSADGNTAVLGGNNDDSAAGAAWIFTRSGSIWTQQGAKLVGTGGDINSNQGFSVAISADGNTVIVGGNNDNSGAGAAWIFTRIGSTWTQQGDKLVANDATSSSDNNIGFGWSVSLSADGNTAILGGNGDNSGTGAAWIFNRSGSTWTQTGNKLVGSDATANAGTGGAVAISADGNTAVVGGNGDNTSKGAVWVFKRSGNTWTQQGSKLVGTGSTLEYSNQGQAVALSADGNILIEADFYGQEFWVFTRSGNTWTQQGSPQVNSGAMTIQYLSVTADASTLIMGANDLSSSAPAAWFYRFSDGIWTQYGSEILDPAGFGYFNPLSAALSADGSTALVGDPNDGSMATGAAWVYGPAVPPTITYFTPATGPVGTLVTIGGTNLGNPTTFTIGGVTAIPVSNDGTTLVGMVMPGAATGSVSVTTAGGTTTAAGSFTVTDTPYPSAQQGDKLVGTGAVGAAGQGYSVILSADGNTAIVGGYADNAGQGAAWVYTRSGNTWSQQGSKLVGTGYAGASYQGASVALSADGNTAMVGGPDDNSGQGAVWVFTRSDATWSQQGSKLVGTGAVGVNTQQGSSVSLSADGNTAIIGGRNDNSFKGAVWVFTRSGNVWSQQGSKLVGTGTVGNVNMGYSVSLSADGNTAIAGGYQDNSGTGACWVFTRTAGTWSQQGDKLVGNDGGGGEY
ncbi:MAG: IPT/TIG domain-containing protein, partial [Mariniphaga sp.]